MSEIACLTLLEPHGPVLWLRLLDDLDEVADELLETLEFGAHRLLPECVESIAGAGLLHQLRVCFDGGERSTDVVGYPADDVAEGIQAALLPAFGGARNRLGHILEQHEAARGAAVGPGDH